MKFDPYRKADDEKGFTIMVKSISKLNFDTDTRNDIDTSNGTDTNNDMTLTMGLFNTDTLKTSTVYYNVH